MKNVYTQEMKDNGELPTVGMKCKIIDCSTALDNVEIKYISKQYVIISFRNGKEEQHFHTGSVIFNPLMSQEVFDLEAAKGKQRESVTQDINTAMFDINEHTINCLVEMLQDRGHLAEIPLPL